MKTKQPGSINLCRDLLESLLSNRMHVHEGTFHRPWQRMMAGLLAQQFHELTEGEEHFEFAPVRVESY